MKPLVALSIISIALTLNACTNAQGGPEAGSKDPKRSEQFAIPDLPTRAHVVGSQTEADQLRERSERLKTKLTNDPNDIKSLLALSEVFITEARITGNYAANHDAALDIIDHVLVLTKAKTKDAKANDQRGEALTLKAVIRLSQHQFQEALELGKEAVAIDPHRAFNYGVLVDANVELGNYAEAVAMSDKMVGTRPDLRSYSRVSYLREIHGDVSGAEQAMEMAIKAGYPGAEETSWCRVQLGGIHERSGDLKMADEQYAAALAERADYPFALAAAGRVAGKLKNYAKAEAFLEQAISRMPDAHFHADLARVYKLQGKETEASEEIWITEETLIGLSGKEHGTTHSDHGHSHEVGLEMARFELEFHKDLPNALANAEHEFEHRENNIEVNSAMAAIHYASGNLSEAQVHLDMAKKTGCKNAELLLIEGLIKTANGNMKAGKKLVKEAFARDPYLQHPLVAEGHKVV